MAHMLATTAEGKAAMAYVGETPWHGYGTTILEGDDLDTIIRKSGADYEVIERPVFYGVRGNDGKKRAVISEELRVVK